METVLRYGPEDVDAYLAEAKEVSFDVIGIFAGFLSVPTSGLLRLVEQVNEAGLKAKPELGIQFGSGGVSTEAELAAEAKKDVVDPVNPAQQALDAGAEIIDGVGLQHVMFEAADPLVFEWYIKYCGNEVNLLVDYSQIPQLEGLRQNNWGNKSTWGRIANLAPVPAQSRFVGLTVTPWATV